MKDDKSYGDFEEVVDENAVPQQQGDNVDAMGMPIRIRIPRGNEKIGIIVQRYGGNRMDVKTTDGKSRNCRVPGRFKRALWLRPGDYVIVVPWVDDDSKGDIIYKYNPGGVSQLRKKGMLKDLKAEF